MSRLTDYAIVLLAHLASRDAGSRHAARELAEATRLPLPVVSKVLKALARDGLLVSHRGAKGGYSLARPASAISAAEVIAALEGPIALTECSVQPGQCVQESSCRVRDPWQRINQVIRQALGRVSLAELAGERALPVIAAEHPLDRRGRAASDVAPAARLEFGEGP